ncbi:hypothetical protein [Acetivibrio cellulolyticus]|uniref:hypothetical protein n=1 Tax=Acetivibrio cellulolyticus TaxID=35830 RepID=UPI0002481ADB|nr:hypothetical protein [Acetivibrio cellulolyticus]
MISNNDRELFKIMEDSLKRYLKAAGLISQEAFDMLSKSNGLLWSEISDQVDILKDMTKCNTTEETVSEKKETDSGKREAIPEKRETVLEERKTSFEVKEQAIQKKEPESPNKEDGPIKLYNKVVAHLKTQNCNELQWVKTYSIKQPYDDLVDFEIKYFEHKDPSHEGKNYILFGDTRKHYSIRKSGDDIVGDTSECFDIILNLSEVFNID